MIVSISDNDDIIFEGKAAVEVWDELYEKIKEYETLHITFIRTERIYGTHIHLHNIPSGEKSRVGFICDNPPPESEIDEADQDILRSIGGYIGADVDTDEADVVAQLVPNGVYSSSGVFKEIEEFEPLDNAIFSLIFYKRTRKEKIISYNLVFGKHVDGENTFLPITVIPHK